MDTFGSNSFFTWSIENKKSKPLKEITKMLNAPYNTTRDWINRIAKDGLKHKYDIKKEAECKLNDKQIKKLLKTLDKDPVSRI